ncbi:hypothetical protein [Salinisphaera sp. G21_0]|uniref:hypothetical protein n=1 Tax=Salinisphaera sp. G21_0 TaxID=2821094 RepID=UPI001ADA9718|nr:hypothetical protein [Salinisphaera sp. G21_0]
MSFISFLLACPLLAHNHPTIAFNPKGDPVHSETVAMTLQAQGNGLSTAVAIPMHDQAT